MIFEKKKKKRERAKSRIIISINYFFLYIETIQLRVHLKTSSQNLHQFNHPLPEQATNAIRHLITGALCVHGGVIRDWINGTMIDAHRD